MSAPPALPAHISNDGREIWDWAARLSEHSHRMHEMGRLRSEIRRIGLRCGDCDKWMKSSECPQEHNVDGRRRGPSMGAFRCGAFVEDRFATKLRDELTGKLNALEVAPEARATAPSNLSAEGAQEACAASDKPTEPNPPNPTPYPSKVGSGEGESCD